MADRNSAPLSGGGSRRSVIGWALYDWANSPFSTLIITFVFATYFSRAIVGGDGAEGQTLWAYTIGISGILIAFLSPILGAIADAGGRRKPWLFVFTALCVIASATLWYAEPEREFLLWAMVWVIIANLAFEFGIVFNNAMLPDLVPGARIGRWSGWAWSIGYFGGLVALAIALVAFVQTDPPLFGLDKAKAEHVRIVGPLVAVWFVVFAWPLFVYTRDRPSSGIGARAAVAQGLSSLVTTLRNVRAYGNAARFLLARMIYNDGLTIVFAIGAIFAADNFGMDEEGIILFGIILNITAGLGALGFAWIDDWLGPKRTIAIALIALIVTGIVALVITEVIWFWVVAAAFGTFMGPAQAASRSLMARLAPSEIRTELFGLYAFSGKATAFVGVLVAGAVLDVTDNQRAGLATAVVFLAVGLGLLLSVQEPRSAPEGTDSANAAR